ncbi:MAG: hypothetical protein IH849_01170 [Acidobacteria bacterium]|nr:hypothetical protein [Acidobacteriota bacterium]
MRAKVKNHTREATPGRRFRCPDCDQTFSEWGELHTHIDAEHELAATPEDEIRAGLDAHNRMMRSQTPAGLSGLRTPRQVEVAGMHLERSASYRLLADVFGVSHTTIYREVRAVRALGRVAMLRSKVVRMRLANTRPYEVDQYWGEGVHRIKKRRDWYDPLAGELNCGLEDVASFRDLPTEKQFRDLTGSSCGFFRVQKLTRPSSVRQASKHAVQCKVCQHPEQERIEREWVAEHLTTMMAADAVGCSSRAWNRHAKYVGLRARRDKPQ